MLVAALHGSSLAQERLGPLLPDSASAPSSSLLRSFRQLNEASKEAQINPSIVVIVVILTIIFFLSGCLHLLIRCLVRNPRRDPNSIVTLTALQGQLQQLFHLHDSGVEQAFIDTLPIFFYKSVKGLKEGADCAVCLCEFQGEDRLRLLPKCSHAFHLDCIDTWLLSHSTCPLCRRSLLPDGLNLPPSSHGPMLESGRSSVDDADTGQGIGRSFRSSAVVDTEGANSLPGEGLGVEGAVAGRLADQQLDQGIESKQDAGAEGSIVLIDDPNRNTGKVLTVKLGRFRIVEGSNVGASTSNNGSRRSYSVGSYEYVLDPSNLEVVIAATPYRRRSSTPRRVVPGHRTTLSECTPEDVLPDPILTPFDEGFFRDGTSPFVLRGQAPGDNIPVGETGEGDENWIAIDLSSETVGPDAVTADNPVEAQTLPLIYKAKQALLYGPHTGAQEAASSSRRAFSFRQQPSDAFKLKVSASRRSLSETEVSGWEDEEQHFSRDQLVGMSGQVSNTLPERGVPSFAKRTINWLVGKQKRIVHSSGQENSPTGQR